MTSEKQAIKFVAATFLLLGAYVLSHGINKRNGKMDVWKETPARKLVDISF